MKCSVVIATHNKPLYLARTLASIRRQSPPFAWEIVVVDDGSDDAALIRDICQEFAVEKPIRIDRPPGWQNPGPARNVGYRAAVGDVVISQSDDVIHESSDAIERLAGDLRVGQFQLARVWNQGFDENGVAYGPRTLVVGEEKPEYPLFYLGSLWRSDLFAIGGNDEDFCEPGYEDRWFSECLIRGRQLLPVFRNDVDAVHQSHGTPDCRRAYRRMRRLFHHKIATGVWRANGGPWK